MRRRIASAAAVLVVLSFAVTGCAGSSNGDDVNGVDPDLTVDEAKAIAMAMELELAGMVPAENVTSVEQSPEGVLLSCDDNLGYQWTGITNVHIQGTIDNAALVDAIVDEYSNRDSFTAKTWEIAEDVRSAHVVGRHGAGYFVHENAEGTAIEVSSFSPCFVLPEGVSPRGRF